MIFTNESNIDRWKNKRQVAVDSKIGRLTNFIKHVNVPMQVGQFRHYIMPFWWNSNLTGFVDFKDLYNHVYPIYLSKKLYMNPGFD